MIKKFVKVSILIVIICFVFFTLYFFCFPLRSYSQCDGGTKIYESRAFTLVKWNELEQYDINGNRTFEEKKGWKIYIYPNQDLWKLE